MANKKPEPIEFETLEEALAAGAVPLTAADLAEILAGDGTGAPEPAVDPQAAQASHQGEPPFELGQWAGHPQWRCRLCLFDTLDGEGAYWAHYAGAHAPPPEPAPVTTSATIFVADRFGNEVK